MYNGGKDRQAADCPQTVYRLSPATDRDVKPLGHKSYGSIGHLPQSRLGPGDHSVHEGQAIICTTKHRDARDRIIVQEKLDGSNVAVARIDGQLVALGRAGHTAWSSPYEQHRLFARWVMENADLFDWLADGLRVCGEWLAQAHGTRYELKHAPFVAFDIMHKRTRMPYDAFMATVKYLPTAKTLHDGWPLPVDAAMKMLRTYGYHGALDPVEGVVYRVERNGVVDFLAKYVRPDKVDGCYLPEVSGGDAVWNWQPETEAEPCPA